MVRMQSQVSRHGCLLLCLSLTLAPSLLSAQRGRAEVREGNRLYEEGRFEDAHERYLEALRENPNSPLIRFNEGNALYQTEEFQSALDASATTIIKNNISWHLLFPSANTTPWQLEGSILGLHDAGLPVTLYYWKRIDLKRCSEECAHNHRLIEGLQVHAYFMEDDPDLSKLDELVQNCGVIVDALLGTGVTRPIEGSLKDLVVATARVVSGRRVVVPPPVCD